MQNTQAVNLCWVVYLFSSHLPGEVHVLDVNWDCRHALLGFPEVVCEWSHLTL